MNQAATVIETLSCYHCGEDCLEESVHLEDKSFCCLGCRTAYQILDESGLCGYYDLESNPGISLQNTRNRSRFDYLEDQEVIERITDFRNERQLSITLYIPNIHCTSCVWLLENLQKLDHGVLQTTVNFMNRELSLLIDTDTTSLRNVVEQLTTIGYEPEIRLDKLDSASVKEHQNRSLWLKLGVAGFAFGNIMLFSFPDYLDLGQNGLGGNFHMVFGALNILLAVPVLLYSSTDYLRSAFAALSQWGVNLDVPISIGIVALFARSVYEIVSGTGTGYMDSFTGLIFFLLIGKLIQQKTFNRLSFDRDYRSYLPIAVNVIEGSGTERSFSLDQLEKGMQIRIRNLELIPCDATLQSDQAFVDYSFITGESEPVEVSRGDLVYAGARLMGSSALLQIQEKVENSYLTKLWNHEAFSNQDKELTLTSFADRISPYFTTAVLLISFLSGLYWLSVSGMESALSVFTAVLIIACPCALALSTPFTLSSALNVLSLNGLFVKNNLLLENLSKTSDIVFDKTGTLTKNESAEVNFHGPILTDEETALVAATCRQSIHPISRKIYSELKQMNTHPLRNQDTDSYYEVPGKGIFASLHDHLICVGSRDFVLEQTSSSAESIPRVSTEGSVAHIAIDGRHKGYFTLDAGIRMGIPEMLKSLKNTFRTFLISGDNLSQKDTFLELFEKEDALLFDQTPQAKLDFISELQQTGKKVTMIGDGLNDAGALKKSDFGIALSDDISAFSPACDAILEGESLNKLNRFISFSKSSMRIILASFGLSLLYNITGLSFAITGHMSPLVAAILMPLSSISVMVFTFFVTRYKAYKLELAIWK